MTELSARQVATIWETEGGPASRAVEWVAIAIGESSLDDAAVSPAGAIGLWQIMPFHAGEYGFTVSDLYDAHVNAYIAVHLSGFGVNCAAWDSAYRDINASGRYSYLAWPEVGSADYNNLPIAAADIGGNVTPLAGQPQPISPGQNLGPAIAEISQIVGQNIPQIYKLLVWERIKTDHLWKLGPRR